MKEFSLLNTAVRGMLLNVLNPKLSFFFLAFLPQFVPVESQYVTLDLIYLAGIFMLLTFMVFVGYGACASLTREYVISRPVIMKWFRRAFAGTFGYLGLKLAFSDR